LARVVGESAFARRSILAQSFPEDAAGRPKQMDPVSNGDRLVVLLRQRLLERSKLASAGRKGSGRAGGEPPRTGIDNVQALAVAGVDDRQLRRALIQNILAEQFGDDLINEAKFQQIVDRVTEGVATDTGSARLLDRIVHELKASAG
jgi:hypothetical protein